MGNLFSKKVVFENQVLAMEARISNMESRINKFILAYSLYDKIFSSDTLSEKAMCFVYSFLISIVFYTFAKLYRFTYCKLIYFDEKKLKKGNKNKIETIDN
ncbi:hypothetical protein DICPUDRAFT_79418 [Dictyostelium purpureum]|uniref:Uncharacterized protein n=1 Tax=Dictyostelium purpureum TaxID=5786 RepID=F0ZMJ1_DICPU|nr:uncharacterized protein DICPUDRAFT_79418 [Dictyostelium purpureum]EGC34826.1 hypothetical protein DICPUDRAFT_79418 [Dictyostelium purpureum]|eukprot:XP_003288633.1 hypothetical protein DICPUDRAFT_79418 [Dictyostelium purpureum]